MKYENLFIKIYILNFFFFSNLMHLLHYLHFLLHLSQKSIIYMSQYFTPFFYFWSFLSEFFLEYNF